ncbi:hypothetical protein JTE90_024552 [Oedothorax gibbosus]|uniref:Uncharacterized protein n=1 Tax=Oedothorax gibbosus TaxID=931172 RepID=A0AAV6VBT2_9ARAC|nr:hypothetical protein JTE90_024552 [Oedothorax gibbosus]
MDLGPSVLDLHSRPHSLIRLKGGPILPLGSTPMGYLKRSEEGIGRGCKNMLAGGCRLKRVCSQIESLRHEFWMILGWGVTRLQHLMSVFNIGS